MAKAIKAVSLYRKKAKVKRTKRHSKKRSSKLKTSKNYLKLNRGQG
jgi:hypothetical protein